MKHMSSSFFLIFLFSASVFAVPEYGRNTDVLNPEYQRRIDEYLRVVDRWIEEGAPYTLKEKYEHHRFAVWGAYVPPHYIYDIDAPGYVLEYQKNADKQFLYEMGDMFFEDDKRSYLCQVLQLSKKDPGYGDVFFYTNNTALIAHDKEKWNQVRDKFRHYYAFECRDNGYRAPVLLKMMPKGFQRTFPYSYLTRSEVLRECQTKEWLNEVACEPYDDETFLHWFNSFTRKWMMYGRTPDWGSTYFVTKLLLRGYEGWASFHAETNANVCALMAGVAVLDGYQFDSSTGVYHLNDIGKRAISFVAKYPHAETAFFLKTIREGGNQAYIDGLLREFGTEQTWQKLFAEAKAPPPETDPKPQEKAATPLTPTAPRKP